jgi:biotin carboxylase
LNDKQQLLMILGAGVFQCAGIRRAVDAGIRVVTVDNDPGNPGHKISGNSLNISTVAELDVLAAAKRLKIDGIATFASDVATHTVAKVASELDLPGPSVSSVQHMASKSHFRTLQHKHGIPAPKFAVTNGNLDFARVAEMTAPVICKPTDSSGSRGVTRVDELSQEQIEEAVRIAHSFSRSGQVCVEEFVEGVEFGGDAFLHRGSFANITITKKHRKAFTVTGHELPSGLGTEQSENIAEAVLRCCQAAGYTDGPLNFDIMLSGDKVVVLEMSPRTGGNGIPTLISTATGFDTLAATCEYALGLEPMTRTHPPTAAGSMVFGASSSGIIQRIATGATIEMVPEVVESVVSHTRGDLAGTFDNGGNALGYAVFRLASGLSYQDMTARLKEALSLALEPACTSER